MEEEVKTTDQIETQEELSTEMHMSEGTNLSEKHHTKLGTILGALLIILVLILGGLYLWGATLSQDEPVITEEVRQIENNEPETPRAEADTQILNTVSPSDTIDAIEADIDSTILDSLDAELEEIDRELDAALNI